MSTTSSSQRRILKELPLLDIRHYYDDLPAFCEQLRVACHQVGFFLLRHDIPLELVEQQLGETRTFFAQSLADKLTIRYENHASFRGYMPLGVENTAGAVDWREQIEYAAIYPPTTNRPKQKWPPYQRLKAPSNPYPTTVQPSLQTTTEAYVPHICRIADCLRRAMCVALGMEAGALDHLFGTTAITTRDDTANHNHNNYDNNNNNNNNNNENLQQECFLQGQEEQPHWVLKLISYPATECNPQTSQKKAHDDNPEETLPSSLSSFGVGGHTDTNFLTLVLQDDVGGLQVFSQGDWRDVPHHLGPGVLVCNLGEQAELLSQGYFLATPHRVLRNTAAINRISVPLFYNPMLSATMTPLDMDNNKSKQLPWERGNDDTHWRRPSNTMLATVGDNTFKSLARSHPDVFRRHHSDLMLLDDGSIIRRNDSSTNQDESS